MGSMEVEVMEARLLRATELNGEMDDGDETGKIKYCCPVKSFFYRNVSC